MYAFISASVAPCALAAVENAFILSGFSVVPVLFLGAAGAVDHNHVINLSTSLAILSFFIQGVSVNAASPNTLISLSERTPSFTQESLIC